MMLRYPFAFVALLALLIAVPVFSFDFAAAEDAPTLIGRWEGVSRNGEPVDPESPPVIVFESDGSGTLTMGSGHEESLTWVYDVEAGTCTITGSHDELLVFTVVLAGDGLTLESEEMGVLLDLRRVPADDA